MAIVGIALLILVSGTVLFLDYSRSSNDQVISSQLNILGGSIMSNAESMYVLGNESWVTIEFNFPNNVKTAAINNNKEMYFVYSTSSGTSHAVFFSDKFNISADESSNCQVSCDLYFTPGMNRIRIKSSGNVVHIYKVS